jgi:lipopolysaccharide export system permease protein
MVFRKSLNRELTMTAIGVFVVLLAILVTTQAINLLGRAAQGSVAIEAVAALIGLWSLGLFTLLLILTVFISVLTVLTRYWREHEMSVWLSSGVALTDWIWPVLRFTIPFAILIGILSSQIGPWATQRSKEYAETLKQREELSAIAPGVFKESPSANRVYFVESFSGTSGAATNIFVQDTAEGKVATVFAKTGHLATNERGERLLVLENGRRYAGEPGQANFEVADFQRVTVIIGVAPKLIAPVTDSQTRPMLQLFHSVDPHDKAELMWRLSMPISALILALLAIPLSYFNPRSGHTYNLMFALVAYLIYQNGLTLSRNWIEDGRLGAWGLLPMHFFMLLAAIALLHYRNQPAGPFWSTLTSALKRTERP